MKKSAELRQLIAKAEGEFRSLNGEKKIEEAKAKIEEIRGLKEQLELQLIAEEMEEEELRQKQQQQQRKNPQGGSNASGNKTIEERMAFANVLRGKATPEERALVTSSSNTDGGYLVPKDVSTQITELKRQYKSIRDIIEVVPVGTESGSHPMEDISTMTELVAFDDTTSGLPETNPKFTNIDWKVANYGAITPMARTFLQDETGGFLNYLIRFFAKKAVMTENKKAFAELIRAKTPTAVTTLKGLKKVFNVDLDPAIADLSVVVCNQSAFQWLDELETNDGKPLLQPDPTQPTRKLLDGKVVHVFSNRELPNTTGATPQSVMFIGALTEGVKLFDRGVYEVAISTEAGFTKNQHIARVIERFDVKQGDAGSYVYVNLPVPTGV
jgi:HK97 family phage major capsid protein